MNGVRAGDEMRVALSNAGVNALSISAVGGGDISAAYRADGRDGSRLFVKRAAAPILAAERAGLLALAAAGHELVVPRPLGYSEVGEGEAILVLDWLEPSRPDDHYWVSLGRGLAALHGCASEDYGFREDNFIGRLQQVNRLDVSWVSFFGSARLEPQVKMAKDGGQWQTAWDGLYRRLSARLSELIPDRPTASLVHGDLWGGNAMATTRGPAIFDPAVYYGDREVDLAMTELFGGFAAPFYSAYREAHPLDAGYDERRDVYNLYHMLNHLNHFGSGYAQSVERLLRKYGS